jgi:hypothetical protein
MHITILGSGSAGNCTLIESDTTRLLVDAGLSGRQIAQRLALIHRQLDQISGVILPTEQSDSVILLRKYATIGLSLVALAPVGSLNVMHFNPRSAEPYAYADREK